MATLRYIPLNPVAHGLCERQEDWRWSSYRATVRGGRPPEFVDVNAVAGIFEGGLDGYRQFVELGIDEAKERARRGSPPPFPVLLRQPAGMLIAHDQYGFGLREIGRALGMHHVSVARERQRTSSKQCAAGDLLQRLGRRAVAEARRIEARSVGVGAGGDQVGHQSPA